MDESHGAGMASRKFLFADEAGDFDFMRRPNGRRYFILCTVTLETCELGHQLLDLRRDLAWHGNSALKDYFHACDDQQCVRDAVFAVIGRAPMRVTPLFWRNQGWAAYAEVLTPGFIVRLAATL